MVAAGSSRSRQMMGCLGRTRSFATVRSALLLKNFKVKGTEEKAGAVVNVAGGYLRNYLVPNNIAVPATKRNVDLYAEDNSYFEPRFKAPTHRYVNEKITFRPVHKTDRDVETLFQNFEDVVNPPKKKLSNKYRGPMNRYR